MTKTDEATQRWADAGQLMATFCADPRYQSLSGMALWFKIMPALSCGQYAIARKTKSLADGQSLPAPVAAILWAQVNDQMHAAFLAATTAPRLELTQWNCGEHLWIIDSPGAPQEVGALLDQLQRERFANRPFAAFLNLGGDKIRARTFGQ
jgi:hemolysin-activating ACP:hemolysin acyltransferase